MRVIIYGRKIKKGTLPYISEVIAELNRHRVEILMNETYYKELSQLDINELKYCSPIYDKELAKTKSKFMITLGGDGTILSAITLLGPSKMPVLGINLGRMGFLANIEKAKIKQALDKVIHDAYTLDRRSMLELQSQRSLFDPFPYALNDISIAKRENSSMISIQMFIDNQYFSTYWADGIIISTPTGSTGYNLSCGGPIVYPSSDSFVITPIAPHSLTVRAMVIPDRSVLRLKIRGRSDTFLCTMDSRYDTIHAQDEITILKSPLQAHLILLEDMSFGTTIREKLNWGRDLRN